MEIAFASRSYALGAADVGRWSRRRNVERRSGVQLQRETPDEDFGGAEFGVGGVWRHGNGSAAVTDQLRSARFDRNLRGLRLETNPIAIDLINNGHTIEQHYEDTGSSIAFEGAEYELTQFHFHTLSEHTIARGTATWRCMPCSPSR